VVRTGVAVIAYALLFASAAAAAPAAPPAPAAKTKGKHVAKKRAATGRPHANSRFENPPDADDTPAVRYGTLDQASCEAELDARQIAYDRETARGIAEAVRLTGPLHGVTFRTDLPDAARAATPYEISDCRLVLALDDFAAILEAHGVTEVRHYSMYRSPGTSWPEDKVATQHAGGMAIDAGRFTFSDGRKLDVTSTFHGAIDAKTCGDGAGPKPATPDSLELREILCDAVARHLFNVVLTPNFNKPHHNHFHLEVTAGVKWFLVH
jgi:hypothetical protein